MKDFTQMNSTEAIESLNKEIQRKDKLIAMYREKKRESDRRRESDRKLVAQFCHATNNSLQPDRLLEAAKAAEAAAKEIELLRSICLGLFKWAEDLGYDIGDVKSQFPS